MSKFCGNCGAELEENAKVCGKCGTSLLGDTLELSNINISNPEKENKIKKKIKLIISLVIGVVVVAIATNIGLSFVGSKGLLRKTMSAYINYDINTLVSASSDIYYYGDDDYAENYFKDKVGSDLDLFESSVGHNCKLSYEIGEIYDLPERKVDELIEDIENLYEDFDSSIISKVIVAELTVTAKQGNEEMSRDLKITMSKENNVWKIMYMD